MSLPPSPPSPSWPEVRVRPEGDAWLFHVLAPSPPRRPSLWRDWGRHAVLFVLTAASLFVTQGIREAPTPQGWTLDVVAGATFTVALLSILLAHEMGHYLACRYYRVDATLPFFLPAPFTLAGTFGAFIRIRDRFPHRRALFDIGVAGPLAGFLVCLPVLALGVIEGRWVPLTNGGEGPGYLGEPLLFRWAVQWLKGPPPAGNMTLAIDSLGLAAWFGLFVTALNLIPVGQLDGGHVTHALLPRWAQLISRAGLLLCLVLLYFRPTWLLWSLLLLLLGRRPHPPTVYEHLPVGPTRVAVGLASLAVFILSFTPSPIMISWESFLQAVGLLG